MNKNKEQEKRHDYKIVISELGISPFRMLRVAFALIGLIPLLIIFYIIIGKYFFYNLLLGTNGFMAGVAIFISLVGFLYAYNIIGNMVKKLLSYSSERKRSDDEKTELMVSVAHDLKTPLTIVKTALHNLLDGIGGALNKVHAGMAERGVNAVNRLISFIDDMLDLSKIGFIRTQFRREQLDFAKIVKDEVGEIYELTKKNNQDLNCRIPMMDSNMWGDGKKISRAVMNLLSNAVKYTPQGGKIDVALSGDEDTVRLVVINSGSGILPEELDRIFDKYERLKKHEKVEGTGLGLSIVKDIADLHKGHLTVKSEPNKETEFNLVLPRDLRTK